jgi:PIN domain nuclease of toxin-antitoxin system
MNRYCLDACALITFFNDEDGSDKVDDLLGKAEKGEIALFMSKVQLLEVYYDRIYTAGIDAAKERVLSILAESITIVDTITANVFYEAGRFKTSYDMSLADSIGVATSGDLGATFVTSDHSELEAVEQQEHLSFLWLPAKPKK